MQLPKKMSGSGRRSTTSMVLVSVSVALTTTLIAAQMAPAVEDHHFVSKNATNSVNATSALSSQLSPPIEERWRNAVDLVDDNDVSRQRVLGCTENGYPVCDVLCYPYSGKCKAAPIELTLTMTTTDLIQPRCVCSPRPRPDECSSSSSSSSDYGHITCVNECAKFKRLVGYCREGKCHCNDEVNAYAKAASQILQESQLCEQNVTGTEIRLCKFACPNGLPGVCRDGFGPGNERCECPIRMSDGSGEFERSVADTNLLYPPTVDPCEIDGLQEEQRVAACGVLCPKAISRGHCSSIKDELGVVDPTAHYCVCEDLNGMAIDGVSPYFLPIVSGKPTAHGKTLYHGANFVFHFAQPCHRFEGGGYFSSTVCTDKCPYGTTGACLRMSVESNDEFAHCFCKFPGARRYWTLNIARKLFPNASSNRRIKNDMKIKVRGESEDETLRSDATNGRPETSV